MTGLADITPWVWSS